MAKKRHYITGIDGLRTLAVLAVISYHLFPQTIKGGYLGVTLFFVISGYLMTDILYQQWEDYQKIKLGLFYRRRIKRLAPSLILVLVLCGAILLFFPHQFLNQFRGVTLSSLFYYNNWWQIAHGVSYFAQFGQAMPFVHLWSLSVEGQFYLVWPIVMGLFFYKKANPKTMITVTGGLAILSAIEMAILYNPNDLNRVYYGTDTRLSALMLGCLLAVILRSYQDKIKELPFKQYNLLGILLLVLIIPCMLFFPDNSPFVYRGGMFLFSIASMFLLGVVIISKEFNNLLTNRLFHWCGTRSYEIYLWQYPVLIVYETVMKLDGTHVWLHGIIQIAIILVLSEITYRIILAYRRNWPQIKANGLKLTTKTQKVEAMVVGLVLLLFLASFVLAPNGKTETTTQLEDTLTQKQQQLRTQPKKAQNSQAQTEQDKELAKASQDTPVPLTEAEVHKASQMKVTAIGDSVLLDAAPELQKYIPEIQVDAEIGRQLKDSIKIVQNKAKKKELASTVIIALGTNGSFSDDELNQMLQALKGHQVYLINTVVPKVWQNDVNTSLAKAAKENKNVHLINWYKLAHGKDDWFFNDGTHMNDKGAVIYANYIVKELTSSK